MAINNLSQRISELSERIKELTIKCVSDPANAPEVLSDALERLQASLEELSAVDEELVQQNNELMRAQSDQRESEQRLCSVLAGMTDAYYFYDREWRFVDINPRAEEYLGRPREELLGFSVWELYPNTVGGKTWTEYHRAMAEGVPVHFETQSGVNPRFFEVHAYPEPEGLAVYLRDITERKQMEAELERLASFPQINPNPIIEVDLHGYVHFINPAAKKLFPGLQESGPNHPWLIDWGQMMQIFRRCGASTYVRDLLMGDMWYQQSMYLVPNTQRIRIYGLDITERKLAEIALQEANEEFEATGEELRQQNDELMRVQSALQESEEKYRTIVETANEGIWVVNSEAQTTYVNKRMAGMLGYSQEEMIGKKSSEFLDEEDKARLELMLERRRQGIEESFEFKFICKDGSFLWALSNATPLRDRDGKFAGSMGMLTDITERKRAEDAIQEAKDHLEMRVKERTSELEQANVRLQDEIAWRKKAEEALRTASSYNRNLIEASLDPLVTIGPDGKITDVNAATEAVTGYGQGDLIGTDFSDYFTEPDKARAGYQQVFKEGFVRDYALEIRQCNGRVTPVLYNASVYRNDAGEIIGVFAAARDETARSRAENELDKYRKRLEELVRERTYELEAANAKLQAEITERKRAEHGLRESEQRFKDAIDNFPNVFVIYDSDRRMRYINSKGLEIIGLSEHEVIGRRDEEIFAPEMIDSYLPALKYAIESRTPQMLERTRHASMGGQVVIINIIPLLDENGNVHQILGITHDITKRKQMEEELGKARDELELRVAERTAELSNAKENLEIINEELQVEISEHEKTENELMAAKETAEAAVEAKAAFLANMSHELRTPLNAVIGFSSLLLADNVTQNQREDIERIRNGGEVLLALISDILEFSRAEKEKVKLELQPFSLMRCIEESMGMVVLQVEEKGLNLIYTVSYGTPDTIIGDQGRLRQVLVNLLSNAVKFTDKGDISVSVSSKVIEGNKRQITFAVKDSGIGMPKDKMDRLFQPFTQLEYTLSRKRAGAGLGLAISKKLVELMGGEIWAESNEGKGSTFWFTIQAETIPGKQLDLSEKEKAAVYENLSSQKPLSILVAEDNPSNQRVLVDMLKRLGYRPDAVADGREVLQALQILPYDLIFMDIRMPEMDGMTATKEIRKLWPENGPKIIALTAFAMDGDREMCLEVGMDGYISKPVKVEDIATLLRNIAPSNKNKSRK